MRPTDRPEPSSGRLDTPPPEPDRQVPSVQARARRRWLRDAAGTEPALKAARGLLRLLGRTLACREVNQEPVERLWAEGRPVIYAVWHGRMLMLAHFYAHRRRIHVLVSRSRDGAVIGRLVEGFGARVVRGSSSRGGATALRRLVRLVRREGGDVLVVPDGPRGPRYVAQAGAVQLARLTGAPIVPIGFGVSRGRVLRTWDEFLVPYPFGRACVVFGEPLVVPAGGDRGSLETFRCEVEARLTRATRDADRLAGARYVSSV